MPISATGRSDQATFLSAKPAQGFTLIELLVVLVIIGVLSVAATLTVAPDVRRDARTDVERLSLLLEAAAVEAQSGGRQLAWSTESDTYSFWESSYQGEQSWLPVGADERFRTRRLSEGLHIDRVEIEGHVVPPAGLLVFRRGNLPLFRIVMTLPAAGKAQGDSIELRGTPTGKVDMLAPSAS